MRKMNFRLLQIAPLVVALLLSCKEDDCTQSERCFLEPEAGPCKAYIPKYYYDTEVKKCKEFIWGGCGGVVPFNTLEECEQCKCSE